MTLRAALEQQARSNASLGSPFTARILHLLAQRLTPGTELTDRLFHWPGELGPLGQSVPLRLLAGLHALVLTGACPELVAVYPPHPAPEEDDRLWAALESALHEQSTLLHHWLDNPPQTNEVRRAVVMIAAGHFLASHFDLPFRMLELGASGGLNLMWDRFALMLPDGQMGPADAQVVLRPDWRGDLPKQAAHAPVILDRRGVDISPLNVRNTDDALRLQSYLWADQPERLDRTRAVIGVFDAKVDQGDAVDWLADQLTRTAPDHLTLIYHTIAWQYFPTETQTRCLSAIKAAGRRGPVAHLSMEADEHIGKGAAITLTLWPDGQRLTLGRVDFHGRWIDWAAP
ncbi:hypothetical protein SAMN04488527_11324 [Aliiroseovarius crassostreae]|uniref:DUF2332 domain-containing protein n=1 Tax=Aliiroseovarius crassostreae TaxID=154981 RepID=A0A0P7IY34_9RHOB|nr:DUF2332 domain-containing protein [Aliiroseovarius crassostreae]KPN63646.1 hypothetical protein AKJ29_13535 [Aliiroseovarius crassostreae]SFU73285.1 hypothetical protein SAMN04488527_11324 [Aliiroseovarius crassostreae]